MANASMFNAGHLSDADTFTNEDAAISSWAVIETGETDKTYIVSNEEFLQAVFAEASEDARPVVVGFSGNPADASGKRWAGKSWSGKPGELDHLAKCANNYFSLSLFSPDENGKTHRRKASFAALHAVMLDDVRIKVPFERLDLSPTWLLETSPSNFQAGYALSVPISDPAEADRLMKAIIKKGLCDPGAGGPTARLARLPVGGNGKHTPVFQRRLTNWNPELLYSADELVGGFHLEMHPAGKSHSVSAPFTENGHAVLSLPPAKSPILTALEKRGLLKANSSDGKHDITCPWVKEHTNEVDGGTVYFEPDATHPLGGFKCMHGHCAERHLNDLLNELGLDSSAARSKATIYVVPGDIDLSVDALEKVLAHSGRFFQKSNHLVEVSEDPGTSKVSIRPVSQAKLAHTAAAMAEWLKYDRGSKSWVKFDPPARVISMLHEKRAFEQLPILEGVARQPFFRPDATLVCVPGYDRQTRKYGAFTASKFSIPEFPTKADACDAMKELKGILSEFPLATKADEAAALSAMFTAVVRPSLAHAPMFHVNAHSPGSGKSYLSALITAFATAQAGVPVSLPESDTECQKLLLSLLVMSPAVIEFDNLTRDLEPMPSLCSVLASEAGSGRQLGVSEIAEFNTQTLFLSSGNNVQPLRDMVRRTVTITLDPASGKPALRRFQRPHLVKEVRFDREKFVSLVLTIIKAYLSRGVLRLRLRPSPILKIGAPFAVIR